MSGSDRLRLLFALGFPLGALGHFWYVWKHGLLHHFERPAWAVWFWYALCAIDLAVCALLLTRPRWGLLAGNAAMAVSLWVNLLVFDSFRHGFNLVVAILVVFGLGLAACTPWLWRRSAWVT